MFRHLSIGLIAIIFAGCSAADGDSDSELDVQAPATVAATSTSIATSPPPPAPTDQITTVPRTPIGAPGPEG